MCTRPYPKCERSICTFCENANIFSRKKSILKTYILLRGKKRRYKRKCGECTKLKKCSNVPRICDTRKYSRERSTYEINRKTGTNEKKDKKNKQKRSNYSEKCLKNEWSINEYLLSSHELDDLDLLAMEEDRVPDHHIDDNRYSEYEEREECIDAILYSPKEFYYHLCTVELALIVKEFAIHDIFIVVEHIFLALDLRVDTLVEIERDAVYA